MAASRHQRHIFTVGLRSCAARIAPLTFACIRVRVQDWTRERKMARHTWHKRVLLHEIPTWRRGVCVAGVVSSWHAQRGAGCRASSWKAYLGKCWRMKGQTWQSRQPNGSWARVCTYIDERTTLSKTGDDNRLSLTVIWWNFRISDKDEIHNI